jgi:hypothetical protein
MHQDGLQTITGRGRAEKAKTTAETLAAGWKQEAGPHLAQMQAVTARAGGGRWGGGRVAVDRPPAHRLTLDEDRPPAAATGRNQAESRNCSWAGGSAVASPRCSLR